MKTPGQTQNLPDFDADLDQDPVWNLFDEAPLQEPGPRFAQDLVRRARLEGQGGNPWWKALSSPKPLIGMATAACACAAIIVSIPNETSDPAPVVVNPPVLTDDWEENFADDLANELLTSAADDPTLLSDSEIIALLY